MIVSRHVPTLSRHVATQSVRRASRKSSDHVGASAQNDITTRAESNGVSMSTETRTSTALTVQSPRGSGGITPMPSSSHGGRGFCLRGRCIGEHRLGNGKAVSHG
jgi:hypothetical protein